MLIYLTAGTARAVANQDGCELQTMQRPIGIRQLTACLPLGPGPSPGI